MSDAQTAVPAAIMEATYRALCEHGYADLTMQDIADEWGKSTAALHYHYDTKHDLLVAFLEYLLADFERRLADAVTSTDDPVDRLRALVDTAIAGPERESVDEFRTAVLEMRAQTPYDPAFRERVAAFDDRLRTEVRRAVVEAGLAGDPDAVADLTVAAIDGAHDRHVTIGVDTAGVERALRSYIDSLEATR
jgi:AcrR family transcriptional regulator